MVKCIWIIGGVKQKILSANLFPTSKCIYLICLCLHPLSLMIGSCPLVFQTVKFFVFEHRGSPSEHPTYQDENKLLPALIFIIEYNECYIKIHTRIGKEFRTCLVLIQGTQKFRFCTPNPLSQ